MISHPLCVVCVCVEYIIQPVGVCWRCGPASLGSSSTQPTTWTAPCWEREAPPTGSTAPSAWRPKTGLTPSTRSADPEGWMYPLVSMKVCPDWNAALSVCSGLLPQLSAACWRALPSCDPVQLHHSMKNPWEETSSLQLVTAGNQLVTSCFSDVSQSSSFLICFCGVFCHKK